jgi:glycosyltransferase involved in cell wall biosynthesis
VPGLVITTGIIAASKNPQLLLDAIELVRRKHHEVKLVFVGDGRLDDFVTNSQVLGRLRRAGAVEQTGYVEEAAYLGYLRSASVVVQLRATTNGESSASVMDAISTGAPVICDQRSLLGVPVGAVHCLDEESPAALAALIDKVLSMPVDGEQSWISDGANSRSRELATIAESTLLAALRQPIHWLHNS